MQHTHTHKAVTGRVEAKSYSPVEGNQPIILQHERNFVSLKLV